MNRILADLLTNNWFFLMYLSVVCYTAHTSSKTTGGDDDKSLCTFDYVLSRIFGVLCDVTGVSFIFAVVLLLLRWRGWY